MSGYRLPTGGLVDRNRVVAFQFDSRAYTGFEGDTLASALLAEGVSLVGRSFKYHRPRGVLTAGTEEPNALVELRSGARKEPNTRATAIELFDGLEAKSQNRWPSLGCDLLAATAPLSPFMGAGFYYKTFMWPAAFWERVYEPLIRRAAGLGRAAEGADPDHYEKSFAFCDVLVIGGGPAGISAALAAGRAGARTILCDEDFVLGGRLLSERLSIDDRPAREWLALALAELESLPDVRLMPRTTVFGAYDHGTYGAVERVSDHVPAPSDHRPRQRAWRIVAKRVVLCSGAIERPLVFGNNDLPGVMIGSAVRTYANRFAVAVGRSVVVATSNDNGLQTASDLRALGMHVAAVVDTRDGSRLLRANGRRQLRSIDFTDKDGRTKTIPCDVLAVSNGWNPTLHLSTHLGGRPVWNETLSAFVPGEPPKGMTIAGAAAGNVSLAEALADGFRLGGLAAAETGFQSKPAPMPKCGNESVDGKCLLQRMGTKGKAFVDFQNDVTDADLQLAVREGFQFAEQVKRYTTLGMGTDQGRTSGVVAHSMIAALTGRTMAQSGTTVYRPPYTPVALGALAGHHRGKDFRPHRLTPSHRFAEEQGAVFVESGLWLRAQYFPQSGDKDWLDAVVREVQTVRQSVGICDVSTLGKIDIQGTDVAEFLDRVYINAWSSLAIGRARYGLMLREDGIAMDDGTTARLGERHFVMTTTTANAGPVMQHLEYCSQVLWPKLDVRMVSVTEQWAQYSIAGPRSRDLLRDVVDREFDLSNEAFPYLAARAVTVGGGIPARLFRISFSGEMAYELAVDANYGDALIRALMAAGAKYNACLYGTEALGVMRIEKGHVAGNELNGQTTAGDLGLGRMMSKKKDFIGRVMAGRSGLNDPDRPRFVGFRPVDRSRRLRAGAHFVPVGKPQSAEHDEGFMSSVAFSPVCNHWVGLGFIKRGPERHGEIVIAADPLRGESVEVEICSPVFVDPGEERLRA